MFIGENPSWADNQIKPFSENTISGKALDKYYLQPLGLSRDEVWITDIIKCRYPKEHPLDIYHNKGKLECLIQFTAEKCCELFLEDEIQHAKPQVIVTLSDKEVYQRFRKVFKLKTPAKFVDAVGRPHHITIAGHSTILFPMIHPDISRKEGDGDNRKMSVRKRWAVNHSKDHLPELKKLLTYQVL
jgi:uracil-DNA glycosylase